MNKAPDYKSPRNQALLLLAHVPWLKFSHLEILEDEFGDPESIVKTDPAKIRSSNRLGERLRMDIAATIENLNVDRLLRKVEDLKITVITIFDELYPQRLKEIHNPPVALFCKGDTSLLDTLSVAIVGSRKATKYGLTMSERIAYDFAELGITVVSGMALGIDGMAHKGALNAGGKTVAVLGCGVDTVYPEEHRGLYELIVEKGLVVSEYPPQSEPMAAHFPERNRIISGLSHGVVVVEAPRKSGALITAATALEQGREVCAIPGLVSNPYSRGCHHLIKNGQAVLIETVDDVLSVLNISKQSLLFGACSPDSDDYQVGESDIENSSKMGDDSVSFTASTDSDLHKRKHSDLKQETGTRGYTTSLLEPLERKVLDAVSYEGTHINELARSTGLTIANLSAVLTMLEIKGVVSAASGGYYQRI